jgi:prevent-host-death family protein
MGKVWQLQEAKNRFSEVVESALHSGPQTVTRHGKEAVVVVSAETYKKLTHPRTRLSKFFHNSPLRGVDLDIERSKDTGREVSF